MQSILSEIEVAFSCWYILRYSERTLLSILRSIYTTARDLQLRLPAIGPSTQVFTAVDCICDAHIRRACATCYLRMEFLSTEDPPKQGPIWDFNRIPMHNNGKWYSFNLNKSITIMFIACYIPQLFRNAWLKHRIVTSPFIADSSWQTWGTGSCQIRYNICGLKGLGHRYSLDKVRFDNRYAISISVGSIGKATEPISTNINKQPTSDFISEFDSSLGCWDYMNTKSLLLHVQTTYMTHQKERSLSVKCVIMLRFMNLKWTRDCRRYMSVLFYPVKLFIKTTSSETNSLAASKQIWSHI